MSSHPVHVIGNGGRENTSLGAALVCVLLAPMALAAPAQVPVDEPVEAEAGVAERIGVATHLVVRARARGAMYVTTDMGAKVTLRDTATGEVLAEGLTIGNVGGTDQELTAAFRTTLSLSKPTRIEASIRAPLSYPHATVNVSSTAWVLPGKHVDGEGWVLELPGFVVTFIDPPPTEKPLQAGAAMEVKAKVVMMCGCPTEPGGRWDSSTYELHASLLQSGTVVADADLAYAGEKSTYRSGLVLPGPGAYELLLTAFDPVTGNVGVARQPLRVR